MSINRGFMCSNCGVIPKATKKTNRVICPVCTNQVTPWEKPLNERSGRCRTCAKASFKLKFEKSRLLRTCKTCSEKIDPDTGEIIRKGVLVDESSETI